MMRDMDKIACQDSQRPGTERHIDFHYGHLRDMYSWTPYVSARAVLKDVNALLTSILTRCLR